MKKSFLMLMVAAAAMVTVSCGKKDQAQNAEAGAEQTEQKAEGAEASAAAATAGENGYVAYDNKKGYTVDIPNGLFKYKNKILDEKDGEEGLLQYTQEADNNMTNILGVNYDEFDSLTPEQVKKDFEEWKGNQKDNNPTFIKEEVNADNWTLIYEYKNSIGDKEYRALKRFYNFEKKATALIEFEYMDSGKAKFTDEIINHVFDSFKFK